MINEYWFNNLMMMIRDEIKHALQNTKDNKGGDMNSYGAGFDDGYLAGLRCVKEYIDETI